MLGSNYFYQNSLERVSILSSAMPVQYCMTLHCTALLGMSATYSGWRLAQEWLDMPILCGTDRIFLRLRKLKCSFYKSQPLQSYLSCFLPWAGIQAMPLVTYYYIYFCCILLLGTVPGLSCSDCFFKTHFPSRLHYMFPGLKEDIAISIPFSPIVLWVLFTPIGIISLLSEKGIFT